MTANAKKLQALEVENVTIQVTNGELRALIDGVTPEQAMLEHPIPAPNREQEVNKIALITPANPVKLDMNPNDH